MPKSLRPPKVHVKDGRYYFVDKNRWTALSRVEEGLRELHRQYAIHTDQTPNTLAAIFAAYCGQPLLDLAPTTQKQYTYFLDGILVHTFGHMMPAEIDQGHIAQYMERRKRDKAAVSGNRERACLSSVFEFAMRQGWAKVNPCRGVRRNKETPDKTLIPSATLSAAIDEAPAHFARVMQFAYITGIRACDLVLMPVAAVTPRGIEFMESKTQKPVVIEWTQTLRELVREILEARRESMHRPYTNKYRKARELPSHERLLTNRFGQPLTERGIISNMHRLEVDFSFRKIRPKAQTDGGDRNVLGHMGQMRERYTRRRKLVPVR